MAAPVVWKKVRDTVPVEVDLEFTDETVEDVRPTVGGVEVEGEGRQGKKEGEV